MKKKCIAVFLTAVLLIFTMCAAVFSRYTAFFKEKNSICVNIDKTMEYLLDNLDMKNLAGTSESDWFFICLCRIGFSGFADDYLKNLENYINSKTYDSELPASLCRMALASYSSGYDVSSFEFSDGKRFFEAKAFNDNGETAVKQGVVAVSYILLIENILDISFEQPFYKEDNLIGLIASYQCPDGGFSVTGNSGDVDTTAIVIQCLSFSEHRDSLAIISSGIDFLKNSYEKNSGYMSFGQRTSESASQALTSYVLTDDEYSLSAYNELMSFSLPDGGFSHIKNGASNILSSVQAFNSLTSMYAAERGFKLYSFSDNSDFLSFSDDLEDETAEIRSCKNYSHLFLILLIIEIAAVLIIAAVNKIRKRRL